MSWPGIVLQFFRVLLKYRRNQSHKETLFGYFWNLSWNLEIRVDLALQGDLSTVNHTKCIVTGSYLDVITKNCYLSKCVDSLFSGLVGCLWGYLFQSLRVGWGRGARNVFRRRFS